MIPPGLVQNAVVYTIAVLTFIHCHRKAHR